MTATAHRTHMMLSAHATGRLASVRLGAVSVRGQAEMALLRGEEVVLDFAGIEVTQSFIDELVGALILHNGPEILQRIVFKNCSNDTRAIIEFVVIDRSDQYLRTHTH